MAPGWRCGFICAAQRFRLCGMEKEQHLPSPRQRWRFQPELRLGVCTLGKSSMEKSPVDYYAVMYYSIERDGQVSDLVPYFLPTPDSIYSCVGYSHLN